MQLLLIRVFYPKLQRGLFRRFFAVLVCIHWRALLDKIQIESLHICSARVFIINDHFLFLHGLLKVSLKQDKLLSMIVMCWSSGLHLILAESFLGGMLSKVMQPWFVFFGCPSLRLAFLTLAQSVSIPRPPFVASPWSIWTLPKFPELVLSLPPFVLCTSLCHPSFMAQRQTGPPFPGMKTIQFLLSLLLFLSILWNSASLYSENFLIMNSIFTFEGSWELWVVETLIQIVDNTFAILLHLQLIPLFFQDMTVRWWREYTIMRQQ